MIANPRRTADALASRRNRTLSTFYHGFGDAWHWRGGGFGTATTTVNTYEVGTLIVDIFDARMKEAVWRGVSMKTLSPDPVKNGVNLKKAVAKMFERLSPAGGHAGERRTIVLRKLSERVWFPLD